MERLEEEISALEDKLLDPFTLTEREKTRASHRYRKLSDELSAAYDRRLPPAAPYRAREGAVEVTAEIEAEVEESSVTFTGNTGLRLKLLTTEALHIGHLALSEPTDRCLLPWAHTATLRAVVRIAFEHLDMRALQMQTRLDLEPLGFQTAGGGWWLLSRSDFERLEHYLKPVWVRRRLYFHPDWSDWVRYRRWRAYRKAHDLSR